jgi:hypothetical protein
MENGPDFIANGLQEWRTVSASDTAFIKSGTPWEKQFVGSVNNLSGGGFLTMELFAPVPEARPLAKPNRMESSTYRASRHSKGDAPGGHPAVEGGPTTRQLSGTGPTWGVTSATVVIAGLQYTLQKPVYEIHRARAV